MNFYADHDFESPEDVHNTLYDLVADAIDAAKANKDYVGAASLAVYLRQLNRIVPHKLHDDDIAEAREENYDPDVDYDNYDEDTDAAWACREAHR